MLGSDNWASLLDFTTSSTVLSACCRKNSETRGQKDSDSISGREQSPRNTS